MSELAPALFSHLCHHGKYCTGEDSGPFYNLYTHTSVFMLKKRKLFMIVMPPYNVCPIEQSLHQTCFSLLNVLCVTLRLTTMLVPCVLYFMKVIASFVIQI